MTNFNIVAMQKDLTVVSEYIPNNVRRTYSYQSEKELENDFIAQLITQGYDYIKLSNENDLIINLRSQLEKLNNFKFSNSEWKRFFNDSISNKNEGIAEKTKKIQEESMQLLILDSGKSKNICLIDKVDVHNNHIQVINQYSSNDKVRKSIYDVTILINGLPLIHIELKRRGVALKEAFNQIRRYQKESFWTNSGLFEFIHIFVISNGTQTKYYSNTTRQSHTSSFVTTTQKKIQSNSFEFTNYWSDSNNNVIPDLVDFTKTFFAKHTILNLITKYCVFTSENLLLVMRPYQIVATERIINKINLSLQYKEYGSINSGGYIWHTTGSGKTLTSFKTAVLASNIKSVKKVIFVVDRKDLDYQTMREYDKFEKGAANGNNSTKVLSRQLDNLNENGNYQNYRIIVTTIQKLSIYVNRNTNKDIYNENVVLIFDECHRSQFGKMHRSIVKRFKKHHIFGFTGTPIFASNASSSTGSIVNTTEQIFGKRLHTYTIVDAINDRNVLPFRIDFINTIKPVEKVNDKKIQAINIDRAISDPERIRIVVKYIIEHFDMKTKSRIFNSIFAVSSIPLAMSYYTEFKNQLNNSNSDLKIATIFSYSVNNEDVDGILNDEELDVDSLDTTSKQFLEHAISDYNEMFRTNFDTSSSKFQNYYKDLSHRVKKKEIDILIVVNMFLTGFDAKSLNTLWVDKNLNQHGLIQAFSRTNRILNSVKSYGNIVCFRDLKEATDKAIALFGNKDARGIVLLRSYHDYYKGFEYNGIYNKGYEELVNELYEDYPIGYQIIGESKKKNFIMLFSNILRIRNILSSFDDFEKEELIPIRDLQDYQSIYIDMYHEFKSDNKVEKEDINDDIIFEIELIKQLEVNIDYILLLVAKYAESNCKDREVLVSINKAIDSSIDLRSKKELIMNFISKINATSDIHEDWNYFLTENKITDIKRLILDENLNENEFIKYMENSFRIGYLKINGTSIDKIMPPMSRFGDSNRADVKDRIIVKIEILFEKYFGV